MTESAADFRFSDLHVGQRAVFEAMIGEQDVDRYVALSGDCSPLHTDPDFARSRGFAGRVVHGTYLTGLISRLVGVHLPGRNCLLHGISMQFKAPVLAGACVRVSGVVDQVSAAVEAVVLRVTIEDREDGRVLATGKINLGFTRETCDG